MNKMIQLIASLIPQRVAIVVGTMMELIRSKIKYNDWFYPQQIFIEVGTRCNRKCGYCPEKLKLGPSEFMSNEIFEKVIQRLEEIKWSGRIAFHITNEPMKDIDLERKIKIITTRLPNAIPTLLTNGDFLSMDRADAMVAAGLLRCTITRHEPVGALWDKRVRETIKKYPRVFRLHTVTNSNKINPGGISDGFVAKQLTNCYSTSCALPIRYDGTVAPCCCDYKRELSLGNISKESLVDIIANFRSMQKQLRDGDRPWDICKKCTGQKLI